MKLEQIDTSTTAGKAEVMRLAAEGRRVVCGNNCPPWKVLTDVPSWDWSTFQYAIIAEPVGPDEVWAVVHDGGIFELFASESVAIGASKDPRGTVVQYRRADLAGEVKP